MNTACAYDSQLTSSRYFIDATCGLLGTSAEVSGEHFLVVESARQTCRSRDVHTAKRCSIL